MHVLKFALKMLKREYKKSMIYTITLSLTIAITFLFLNIIDNQYLLSQQEASVQWFYTQMPFSTMLSFLIITFCAFMIVFANNFYISRKTKEIAIMTMSGASFLKVTLYLIYQNLVMTFIAFVLGVLLGAGLSLGVNQLIYHYLYQQVSLFYLPVSAIGKTVICILSILFAQMIYISGFVYRKDIHYLLSQETKNVLEDERIFKIPPLVYVLLYVLGLGSLFMSYSPISAIFPCFIGALGVGGMVKYVFPTFFHQIKEKKFLAHKIYLISLSHLYYSLRRACVLIGLFAVSSSVMIAIMIMQKDNPREFITAIIGFIVMLILLLASIVYKYLMEASSRGVSFYNLYKMGYTYKQLKTIIFQEVVLFYTILVMLPLIYIILALLQAYFHHDISLFFVVSVVMFELIAAMIACMLTYISYKKNVLKIWEEGIHYE